MTQSVLPNITGSVSGLSVSHRAGYHPLFCHVLDRTESPQGRSSQFRLPRCNRTCEPVVYEPKARENETALHENRLRKSLSCHFQRE